MSGGSGEPWHNGELRAAGGAMDLNMGGGGRALIS